MWLVNPETALWICLALYEYTCIVNHKFEVPLYAILNPTTIMCPFLLQGICINFVVYIKSEDGVYTTRPLPLSEWNQLEFFVSTEDSGLKYNSKYQMTLEGGHGSERWNASRTFLLSEYISFIIVH